MSFLRSWGGLMVGVVSGLLIVKAAHDGHRAEWIDRCVVLAVDHMNETERAKARNTGKE